MKILITGSKGQLGNELQDIIKTGEAEIGTVSKTIIESEVITLDINELDITNLNQVRKTIFKIKPDVLINCAAATNVDSCESSEDLAFKVNSIGPRNLAIACEEINSKIVQISTDYVFSGEGNRHLAEYDITDPYTAYGKTKLLGERYVREFSSKYFIIRTSWLYGRVGHNFVHTIMKLGKEKDYIKVVSDQKGNPTNANDLAYHILKLIETEEYGVYHCTGKGECTWHEFAEMVIKLSGEKCDVQPCTSEEYNSVAKRPKYSSLDNMMLRSTIGDEMRNWQEALKSFIEKLEK